MDAVEGMGQEEVQHASNDYEIQLCPVTERDSPAFVILVKVAYGARLGITG